MLMFWCLDDIDVDAWMKQISAKKLAGKSSVKIFVEFHTVFTGRYWPANGHHVDLRMTLPDPEWTDVPIDPSMWVSF